MKKLIYVIPLFFAFILSGGPPQGWYQQFLPYIDNKPISDMVFLDSLTGLISTDDGSNIDTNYILKTTNGGDSWNIVYSAVRDFANLFKLNDSTVYSCAGNTIFKTTDRGNNWIGILGPGGTSSDDIYALNEDTLWVASSVALTGGIFRSTNGGGNWVQINGAMPSRIYFINANTGFYTDGFAGILFRTTDGGFNWSNLSGTTGFKQINFINDNTGWKATGNFYSTTDAGQTWEQIELPSKNDSIILSRINDFSVLNEDTIWGVGSLLFIDTGQGRSLLYITTDGGNTWGYQTPNVPINSPLYDFVNFTDKNHGWAYWKSGGGVHTVTGGDTTIILDIEQISSEVPTDFKLEQNYPNPFNPTTSIKFKVESLKFIELKVYDIRGKLINTLVSQKLSPGEYRYQFDGTGLSSGVYFYSLSVDGAKVDTKKMLMIK